MIGLVSLALGGGVRPCREKAGLPSDFTPSPSLTFMDWLRA